MGRIQLPLEQRLGRGIVEPAIQGGRVNHRDDAVQAGTALSGYDGRHAHGIGDAAGLDNDSIGRGSLGGEAMDGAAQFGAQGATAAAIGQFGDAARGSTDEGGVDVDRTHVIDHRCQFQAVPVLQKMAQQGGLARTQESGQNCHADTIGQRFVVCAVRGLQGGDQQLPLRHQAAQLRAIRHLNHWPDAARRPKWCP